MATTEAVAGVALAAIAAVTGNGKHYTEAERSERVRAWAATLTPCTPEEARDAVRVWYETHDQAPKPSNVSDIVKMRRRPERTPVELPGSGVTFDEWGERYPEEHDALNALLARLRGKKKEAEDAEQTTAPG